MTIRVWGSVQLADGSIACDVRDFERKDDAFRATLRDPAFRWCKIESLELGRGLTGHSKGPLCAPGQPCAKCQKGAARWWREWGKRDADWQFRGVSSKEIDRTNGWSSSEWTEPTKSLSAAFAAAREKNFEIVVEQNGHGRERRRLTIATMTWTPNAPDTGTLFDVRTL
jgi:hypothetical protein